MISPLYQGPIYEDTSNQPPERDDMSQGMGQEAFLKMFMTQVTNQNPLDPMDNTEFTAQLATFSQLEQLTKIAEGVEKIDGMSSAMMQNTALSLLGKEAVLPGDMLPVSQGYVGEVGFTLEQDAQVLATVTDETGLTVAEFDLGRRGAGANTFLWDGTNYSGQAVDDGVYRVSLTAYGDDGNVLAVSDQTASGLVTGYQQGEDGVQYLLMGDAALDVAEIISVKEPAQSGGQSARAAAKGAAQGDDEGLLATVLKGVASVGGLAALL